MKAFILKLLKALCRIVRSDYFDEQQSSPPPISDDAVLQLKTAEEPIKERDNRLDVLLASFTLLGLREIRGKESNKELLALLKKWAGEKVYDDSKIAWCVIALNEVLYRAGLQPFPTLVARELLNQDYIILTDEPKPGDIAVYWRESRSSWKGHAHIFLHSDGKYNYGIGGNQADQFNVRPYSVNRVLGYIDSSSIPLLDYNKYSSRIEYI